MFGVLYTSQDVVSSAFAAALLATFSTAILCFVGLTWSGDKWRLPVAMEKLKGIASAVSAGAASVMPTACSGG